MQVFCPALVNHNLAGQWTSVLVSKELYSWDKGSGPNHQEIFQSGKENNISTLVTETNFLSCSKPKEKNYCSINGWINISFTFCFRFRTSNLLDVPRVQQKPRETTMFSKKIWRSSKSQFGLQMVANLGPCIFSKVQCFFVKALFKAVWDTCQLKNCHYLARDDVFRACSLQVLYTTCSLQVPSTTQVK